MWSWATDTLDLFWPRVCLVCERCIERGDLCSRCETPRVIDPSGRCSRCFSPVMDDTPTPTCTLCRLSPLPYSRIRYLWEYTDQVRDLIHSMKYRKQMRLARVLGEMLAMSTCTLFGESSWDLIIPLPPSRLSLSERGMSHTVTMSAILVHTLFGRRLSFEERTTLQHRGYRKHQVALDGRERLINVSKAFHSSPRVTGGRVLLVDDVVTSGATTFFATKTLLAAGASSVDILAIARSSHWEEYRARFAAF